MKIKTFNYKKGKFGEDIARDFLLKKDFELIEQNYQNKIGEIDLIMAKDGVLVFVEVKLKIGDRYGTPEEMIGKGKLFKIRKTAESYLVLNSNIKRKYAKYRIDVVCMVMDENKKVERISYYENLY